MFLSHSSAKLINEKDILHMMLSLYLLEIVEKKHEISSKNDLLFFNGLFYVCKSAHCASSKNLVLELFILHVVILNSLDFFKYLSKLIYFISNGIQINRIFLISKKLSVMIILHYFYITHIFIQ